MFTNTDLNVILDKRLSEIYSQILPCDTLADIGCDHGFICVKALIEKKANFAIGADISFKSLNKAIKLSAEAGVEQNFKAVVSDGFDNVGCFDTAVIAGMGGSEIISILKKADVKDKRLILVPHKNPEKLREYLFQNEYPLVKDYVVADGKFFYNVLVSDKNFFKPFEYKDVYRYVGFSNKASEPDFALYLKRQKSVLAKIASSCTEQDKLSEINKISEYLMEAEKW